MWQKMSFKSIHHSLPGVMISNLFSVVTSMQFTCVIDSHGIAQILKKISAFSYTS